MSQENPIVIDQDKDEEQIISQAHQAQKQLTKGLVQMNSKVGQFQIYILIAKMHLPGTMEEKEAVIRRRIKKFFQYHIDIQSGYFHPRLEPDYSDKQTKPLPDSLIIYGVDFLATKNIRKKFKKYDPEVQWIDDSHCKLNFTNSEQVKNFLQEFVKDKEKLDLKMEQDSEQQYLPRNWFELYPPYYELNFERKLFVRYATTKQISIQKNQVNKFVGYFNYKKQFQDGFLREQQKKVLLTARNKYYQDRRKNFDYQRPYTAERQYSRSRNKRYQPYYKEDNYKRRFNQQDQSFESNNKRKFNNKNSRNNSRVEKKKPFSRRSSISMSENNDISGSRITVRQARENQNADDSFSMTYRDDKNTDRNEQLNLSIVQHLKGVNINDSINQDISMEQLPEQQKNSKKNNLSFESLLDQDSMAQPEKNYTKNNQSFSLQKKRQGPLNRHSRHSYADYDKKQQIQEQMKKKRIDVIDLEDQNQW